MAERRTVADLRCHGKELLELCCRTGEPVFLSGGEGEEGVLLSRAAYEARGEGTRRPVAGQLRDPGALRERFAPAELTGYLAFLAGLTEEPAPASPRELVKEFTWAKVKRAPICIEQL